MNKIILLPSIVASTLLLQSCSTITQGTSQDIYINTNPLAATCVLEREGQKIGEVTSTPGSVRVSKTKHDINITCSKEGYQTASHLNNSGWESATGAAGIALDVVLTLGASSAIDSMTGADNKYAPNVNITLIPIQVTNRSEAKPAS